MKRYRAEGGVTEGLKIVPLQSVPDALKWNIAEGPGSYICSFVSVFLVLYAGMSQVLFLGWVVYTHAMVCRKPSPMSGLARIRALNLLVAKPFEQGPLPKFKYRL